MGNESSQPRVLQLRLVIRRLALLFALLVAVVACGRGEIAATSTTTIVPPITTAPTTTTQTPGLGPDVTIPDNRPVYQGLSTETLPDNMTLVAMMMSETDVFDSPDADQPSLTLPATTIIGTTTVLTILDGPDDGWARVMLPIRPNGSEGWIRTDSAQIYVVEGRVVINLSERVLTYYNNGEEVLSTPVAIGTSRNQTPTGDYFITDNVTLADPNSPWGPHAFGLSARSDTITEYNGGDGIIGIHGTNKPGSIGNAISLGCIRLPNDVITRLHEMIPIGTPVTIAA